MYADVTGMGAYCPTTNVVRPYANFLLLDEVNSSLCGSSTHRGLLNRPLLLEDISFLSWNEVNICVLRLTMLKRAIAFCIWTMRASILLRVIP